MLTSTTFVMIHCWHTDDEALRWNGNNPDYSFTPRFISQPPHSVTFILFHLMKMLHHADAVPPPHHERRSGRSRRHREDRDHQRPGPSPGHHGLRVQLLWADGLQGERVCVAHAWLWPSHLQGHPSFHDCLCQRYSRHSSSKLAIPPTTQQPFSFHLLPFHLTFACCLLGKMSWLVQTPDCYFCAKPCPKKPLSYPDLH